MKVVGGRKGKGEYNVMIKFLKRIEKCVCPCVLCIFIETRGSSVSYSYVLPYFESFIFVLHACMSEYVCMCTIFMPGICRRQK